MVAEVLYSLLKVKSLIFFNMREFFVIIVYDGFSPDLEHAEFEIYTIVRLVTQVPGH